MLHIKFVNGSMNIKAENNEVRRLTDADAMGRRFIQLGDKFYNMDKIEYWQIISEESVKRKPERPKPSTLRMGY